MNAKTHMAVGAASAATICLLTNNTEIANVTPAICMSIFASLVPDVDANDESKFKNLFEKFLKIVIVFAIIIYLYSLYNHIQIKDLTTELFKSQFMIGLGIFAIVCLIGYFTSHRSFTHSIIAIPIFSIGIYIIFGKELTIFYAIGMLSHDLIDCLNKESIKLFFPLQFDCSLYKCEASSGTASAIGILFTIITVMELLYIYQDIWRPYLPI